MKIEDFYKEVDSKLIENVGNAVMEELSYIIPIVIPEMWIKNYMFAFVPIIIVVVITIIGWCQYCCYKKPQRGQRWQQIDRLP
jgi:hypothetical protein